MIRSQSFNVLFEIGKESQNLLFCAAGPIFDIPMSITNILSYNNCHLFSRHNQAKIEKTFKVYDFWNSDYIAILNILLFLTFTSLNCLGEFEYGGDAPVFIFYSFAATNSETCGIVNMLYYIRPAFPYF